MKKQDDILQQLFDDYASELKPRDDLSSAARYEMTALNAQQKPSTSARKNKGFVRHLGWIIPVSFVFIFIVSFVSVFAPVLGLNDLHNGSHNAQNTPVAPKVYTFADVKGRSVSKNYCDGILQISRIEAAGCEVVSERYYAFYTDKGDLRYIRAMLGVRTADGEFTEIELIAEVEGYVREDLQYTYDSVSVYQRFVSASGYADNGEYVTQAFFVARNMHFYVVARNGQSTEIAEEIISLLAD